MCMSYAFHTPDKLSFILDLMNGESQGTQWLIPGPRAMVGLSHGLEGLQRTVLG